MLPLAILRPHHPAECDDCGPRGQGHKRCQNTACPGAGENNSQGRIATHQTQRHATRAEFTALPEGLRPIDGRATVAVFGCEDCAEDAFEPFCEHPTPQPAPCATCGANGDAPCTKPNGNPRGGWHHARQAAQPRPEPCRHAHREDCDTFNGCACTGDDQPPERPKAAASTAFGPDVSGLRVPVAVAQTVLAQAAVPWGRLKAVRSMYLQDNRDGIAADLYQYDDAGIQIRDIHGHEVVETVGPIPLDVARG